ATVEADFFGAFNGVPPYGDEQPQFRIRNCGCSSPYGGTPLKAPKKSASTVARGAHFPRAGGALKVKLRRVFRTSPSTIPWLTPGWLAGAAAISAFCPCPKKPNSPRLLNSVASMNP